MGVIGAVLGDVCGSQFEFDRSDYAPDFELFSANCTYTDDTVLTMATLYALQNEIPFAAAYTKFMRMYPDRGYGKRFMNAALSEEGVRPYNSFGNGAAMRVSPVVDFAHNAAEVINLATLSAQCSHNHPEGVTGAVVTAMCEWLARQGASKEDILKYASYVYDPDHYEYSPVHSIKEIAETYTWDVTAQGSVPVAIRCFYESESYEDFLRKVCSLPCDSDTLCAIGGCIAEEYYKGTGLDNQLLLKWYVPATFVRELLR